jgi:hypothetical protein
MSEAPTSFIPNDEPVDQQAIAEMFDSNKQKILQHYESEDQKKLAASAQQIVLDDSNKVSFPDFPYTFEALNEKILVSIDVFKSGYECKTCHGKKKIEHLCICVHTDRVGFRYDTLELEEIEKSLGTSVCETRSMMLCTECGGFPESVHTNIKCPDCKGVGATLILPDASKNLPSTGVIVSMGRVAKEKSDLKIGDRILFSPHAGQMIPTKAGLMFKYMDWYNGALKIEGASEMSAFDFIIQEDN